MKSEKRIFGVYLLCVSNSLLNFITFEMCVRLFETRVCVRCVVDMHFKYKYQLFWRTIMDIIISFSIKDSERLMDDEDNKAQDKHSLLSELWKKLCLPWNATDDDASKHKSISHPKKCFHFIFLFWSSPVTRTQVSRLWLSSSKSIAMLNRN